MGLLQRALPTRAAPGPSPGILGRRCGQSGCKGLQGKGIGSVIIEERWGTDPFWTTERAELSKGLVEVAWARASRPEEIELFTAQRHTLARQNDALDRCVWWVRLDFETQQAQ